MSLFFNTAQLMALAPISIIAPDDPASPPSAGNEAYKSDSIKTGKKNI